MPNLPTRSDLFRIGRDEIMSLNAQVTRDAVEREGMDANILVASASAMGDEVTGQVADLASALYLASAVGTDLDKYVYDRYGLTRKAAAASVGSVNFTTATPSPSTFPIPSGTVLQAQGGTQFITTEDAIFLSGTTGPVVVMVRSVLAGPNVNANINTITSIVSAIPSSATNLTVNNPLATAGAAAVEDDDALRDRARTFFTTARRGTLTALEQAALGVAGVNKATAIEVLDALGRPAKIVQLVITDSFTEQFVNYTTIPPLFPAQSQALSVAVQSALSDVRPAGTPVPVIVANIIIQPVQLVLAFQAGANVPEVALEARAAAVNYVNGLNPGQPFVSADLEKQLQLVPNLFFTGNEVVSPLGTVIPKPLQVIRTTLGLVSAVAAQTNTPLPTGSNPDAFVPASG